MVKLSKSMDFSKMYQKSLNLTNLSLTTSLLHMITMHLSFCMHLGIYLSSPGLQYEQNLTTGIRIMLENVPKKYDYVQSKNGRPLTDPPILLFKHSCSTSHVSH